LPFNFGADAIFSEGLAEISGTELLLSVSQIIPFVGVRAKFRIRVYNGVCLANNIIVATVRAETWGDRSVTENSNMTRHISVSHTEQQLSFDNHVWSINVSFVFAMQWYP
jgi:hypothetical protein